jgi:hypothetical protein
MVVLFPNSLKIKRRNSFLTVPEAKKSTIKWLYAVRASCSFIPLQKIKDQKVKLMFPRSFIISHNVFSRVKPLDPTNSSCTLPVNTIAMGTKLPMDY